MVVSTSTPVAAPETTALGQSEHDKAMIAKADLAANGGVAPAEEGTKPVKPEGVPDKFWDAEKGEVNYAAWGKSTGELEAKLGQPKAAAEGAPNDAAAAAEAAKAAGADATKVDFTALSAEYATNGTLTDASYAALEASGLSRDLVDSYIAGQEALAQTQAQEAFTQAGGEQTYYTMLDWAGKNLPKAEQAAFDKAVVGDAASRSQAIIAMKARFEAAVGRNPTLVQGNGGASTNGAYQSRAEVTADMRDPRYAKDPAFRAKVQARLAVSTVF